MRTSFLLLAVCGTVGLCQAETDSSACDPTSAYKQESIEGFTILINRKVLEEAEQTQELRKELAAQLKSIVEVLPAKLLPRMRKVRIWVEWDSKPNGAAEYHPSAAWLEQHGYNPAKAGGIELSNARNFVAWSRSAQPWMVLHELAHAYHHRVLGHRHAGIHAAYQNVVDQKLYESVEFVQGGRRKAYALTNEKEYFAELTESYFGKNDFYPFNRTDLKTYDPTGYELMKTAWGKPRRVSIESDSKQQ